MAKGVAAGPKLPSRNCLHTWDVFNLRTSVKYHNSTRVCRTKLGLELFSNPCDFIWVYACPGALAIALDVHITNQRSVIFNKNLHNTVENSYCSSNAPTLTPS